MILDAVVATTPDDVYALAKANGELLKYNGERFWTVHVANFWLHVATVIIVGFLFVKYLRMAQRAERILRIAELHGEITDGRRRADLILAGWTPPPASGGSDVKADPK